MKVTFVCALHDLTISENLGNGDRIDDALLITNDPSCVQEILRPEVVPMIGKIEAESITSAGAVLYCKDEITPNADRMAFLLSKLALASAFLSALWLDRDNSVNHDLGFLIAVHQKGITVDSNSLAPMYSTSRGARISVAFTREEIRSARRHLRERVRFQNPQFGSPTQLDSSAGRYTRAEYHAQAARSQGDLGMKIAGYCSALEALLSTSQYELAHQLSERVAVLLGSSPEERLQLYRSVKSAYGIRSRITHGGYLRGDQVDGLATISEHCDTIVRRCLLLALTDQRFGTALEEKPDALDEYMLALLFDRRA